MSRGETVDSATRAHRAEPDAGHDKMDGERWTPAVPDCRDVTSVR